jgi:hypothetical protein
MITSQKQIREQFWAAYPELEEIARKRGTFSKGQNSQNCDTRCAFVDFVDSLAKSGEISWKLAQRATLGRLTDNKY